MLDFIKKQWIAFYASIVVVILSIVSIAIYGADAADPYFGGIANGTIIALTIIAIIIDIAVIVGHQFFKENKIAKPILDGALIIVSIFLAISLMLFVKDRVYYLAIVYGSDLEKGNDAAFASVSHSIVGFVLYGITLVASIVTAFFSVRRKEIA